MKNDYKKISGMINELTTLHDTHISSFNHELLPDLENQSSERNRVVKEIVIRTNSFIKKAALHKTDEAKEMITVLEDRIKELLKQNIMLSNLVRTHKEGIEKSMRKISTGKKIIRAYGSPSLILNKSRAISFTE